MAAMGLGDPTFGGHQQRHKVDESRSPARIASGGLHASPHWRHYVWLFFVYALSRDTKAAWQLKQQGWPQRQIATALGVSEAAVSQWMKCARETGPEALRHRPPPGIPSRLSAEQLAHLPELLHRGPAAFGFRGELWTHGRIAAVIRLEFGISYHPVHVGRLCKAVRWSPQKPARRARQRDGAAIVRWRQETWPAIKRGHNPSSKVSSS
jgi:transposase